jgi:hypothetical protein
MEQSLVADPISDGDAFAGDLVSSAHHHLIRRHTAGPPTRPDTRRNTRSGSSRRRIRGPDQGHRFWFPKKPGMYPGPHSSILEYSPKSICGPGHHILRLPDSYTSSSTTLDLAKATHRPSGHSPHEATRPTNRVLARNHERDRDLH